MPPPPSECVVPPAPAALPATVQLLIVSVPKLSTPPPKLLVLETTLPPVTVRPLRDTTRLRFCDQIWPIRKTRSALLPLIVRLPAPGPLMATGLVMLRAPPVSVMVWGPEGKLNWMVSLLPKGLVVLIWPALAALRLLPEASLAVPPELTSRIASRRSSVGATPETVSARLLTVRVAGASRPSSASSRGRTRRLG